MFEQICVGLTISNLETNLPEILCCYFVWNNKRIFIYLTITCDYVLQTSIENLEQVLKTKNGTLQKIIFICNVQM